MTKKDEKSFEESLKELEIIVKNLESGNVNLDDAISEFEKGMNNVSMCNEKLKKAEENVNKILKENGKLENFELED